MEKIKPAQGLRVSALFPTSVLKVPESYKAHSKQFHENFMRLILIQ